jgi:hypothetical protein
MEHIAEWIGIGLTVVGGIITTSRLSANLEARISTLETIKTEHSAKLDKMLASLARIEGQLSVGKSRTANAGE